MIVKQAQEELQNQLDREFQNIQMSEGAVSHAVDERNVSGKDYVEPDSGEEKIDVESKKSEEKDTVKIENGRKDDIEPERGERKVILKQRVLMKWKGSVRENRSKRKLSVVERVKSWNVR